MLDGSDRDGNVRVGDGAAGGDDAAAWRAADGALRRLARRRAALDVEEAAALVRARALAVHEHLGLATFAEYVERVLGHAPHTARERLRVADALATLPATRAAMVDGRVGWSAVRELTRVATAATEDAWLAATDGLTVREIEDRVRGRRPGDGPGDPPAPDARLHVLRFEVSPATVALYVATQRALEGACGHPLTDDVVLAALCRQQLAGGAAASHVGPADTPVETVPAPVDAVTNNLPPHQIAITTCAGCQRTWSDAGGRTVELSPRELARASCDATLLGPVDGGAPARATRSIPPARRRAVLRRDRGRCVVPGCGNARFVDVHHVVWRSRGGDHAMARLVTLCSAHHDLVHDQQLVIDGTAPHQLRFRHPDGRPWGQLQPVPSSPPLPGPATRPSTPGPAARDQAVRHSPRRKR